MLLFAVLYATNLQMHFTWDSFQYLSYGIGDFFKTGPDELRLFGYGTVFQFLCLFASTKNALLALIALQFLFWFVGGACLFASICALSGNRKLLAAIFTILYLLSPSVLNWNMAILTEAFTLSFTCIYLFGMVRYLQKPSLPTGVGIVVLCLLMVTFRPGSVLFLGITTVFFVAKLFTALLPSSPEKDMLSQQFSHLRAVLVSLGAVALVLLYAVFFYGRHGNFSLSNTLLRQQLYLDVQYTYYQNTDWPIGEDIDRLKNEEVPTWNIMEYVQTSLGNKQAIAFHKSCIAANKGAYAKNTLQTFCHQSSDHFEARHTLNGDISYYGTIEAQHRYGYDGNVFVPPSPAVRSIFAAANRFGKIFSIGSSALVAVVSLTYVLYRWLTKRYFSWPDAGIAVFIAATLWLTFTGQCAEWGRTALPVLPFLYLSAAVNIARLPLKVVHRHKGRIKKQKT